MRVTTGIGSAEAAASSEVLPFQCVKTHRPSKPRGGRKPRWQEQRGEPSRSGATNRLGNLDQERHFGQSPFRRKPAADPSSITMPTTTGRWSRLGPDRKARPHPVPSFVGKDTPFAGIFSWPTAPCVTCRAAWRKHACGCSSHRLTTTWRPSSIRLSEVTCEQRDRTRLSRRWGT